MKKMQDLKDIKAELKTEEERIRSELAEVDRKISAANTESDEIRLEELKKSKFDKEQEKADAEKILDLLKELEKATDIYSAKDSVSLVGHRCQNRLAVNHRNANGFIILNLTKNRKRQMQRKSWIC